MIKLDRTLIQQIAQKEQVEVSHIERLLESGELVILKNRRRDVTRPCGVGRGLDTKVNANIGLSPASSGIELEMEKMAEAVRVGADTVMDLSTGPLLGRLRERVLAECPVPVGTVPIYELACQDDNDLISASEKDFLEVLKRQAEEGVDFFTIHAGITLRAVELAKKNPRIMNIVSRGGALLASWMSVNKRENPFFSMFDEVLNIVREYDIVLSLGDSLRPGAIADATDRLQLEELFVLGDLQKRALSAGVQVIIEGPGHVPLDQIEANVKLQKSVCHGAPFYVLGPLVTDAAPGYDHITGAIGGAIAAWHGADYLCYVTPAEHLRLPSLEDVRNGVMASRIAAHAADIVKGRTSAIARDNSISRARARRDWKEQFRLALDPDLPFEVRSSDKPENEDVCTMCSEYCSIKITEEKILGGAEKGQNTAKT
jgi:phosphomethylpyrimidine synthase